MTVTRNYWYPPQKRVVRSGAGFNDVKSMVMDSTKVDPIAPGNPGEGVYIVEAGTVMAWVQADAEERIMPLHMNPAGGSGGAGAYAAADIVGIMLSNQILLIGTGAPAGSDADVAVGILHHGVNFDVRDLVGYTGNEAIVKSALPTCIFTDVSGLIVHVEDL